ncbi:hypothetical protein, partial [Sandarakinorhabdus sp.]|uniref:hypothetical protein n=1 Tax=Sandarakinorhabdus sp. TaxID=1916663 RepID=UPI00286E17C6
MVANFSIQKPPEGDARYRVWPSSIFYVADLGCGTRGCTLVLNESAERKKWRFPEGKIKIQYKNKYYELVDSEKLIRFVEDFVKRGVTVYIGDMQVRSFRTRVHP